jgi:peroxiredoxin Q/BCP
MWRMTGAVVLAVGACVLAADLPVKEGGPAPEVLLPVTGTGKDLPGVKDGKLALKDIKKPVVLFFYPKAMTKGCTVESCGFRDTLAEFTKLDTVVIGISTDKLADQEKFVEMQKLTFPLLADDSKTVTKAFGALSEKGTALRYTFVIDQTGVIRKIYTKVAPADHPKEVLEFVKTLVK